MGEWIEHTGNGLPVPVGTMVYVKCRNGEEMGPYAAFTYNPDGCPKIEEFSQWHWALPENLVDENWHVIAYRLSDTDDRAKREARIELFRGIAKSKEFLIEETLKPREKVK